MTDWRKTAEAQGLSLSESDMAVAAARLGALEQRLMELVSALSPADEPAPIFQPEEPGR